MAIVSAFRIDDVVYLRSSAQIGFLEAYKISGIFQLRNDRYVYTIDINRRPPSAQTLGDHIDLKRIQTLYFTEDELLTFCEAETLVVQNLERRLREEKARFAARCSVSPGSGSTGPTPPGSGSAGSTGSAP
jgi:hypothetical protein